MDSITKNKLNKYLNIEKNKISTKIDCEILLNTSDYKFEDGIVDNYEILNIPGTFEIVFPKVQDTIKLYLPYNINLIKPKEHLINSTIIKFNYKAGDEILFGKVKSVETDIDILGKILENQIKYLNGEIDKQLEAAWKQLLSTSNIQMIHLETILSNAYLSDDKSVAYRQVASSSKYNKKNAVNTKVATHELTKSQGFSYGYSNDAILTNVSKKDKSDNLTDMEKIIKGDYDELGKF